MTRWQALRWDHGEEIATVLFDVRVIVCLDGDGDEQLPVIARHAAAGLCRRMFESGILRDESLQNASRTWAVHPPLWRYMKKVSRVYSDWIFGYAATQLGIPQFGFSEVISKWKAAVPNPNLRYAITHPVR